MTDEPKIEVEVSKRWRGMELSDDQIDRLKLLGEEAFQAELLGLSTTEVREFIATQGILECGMRTKSGSACRRITAVFLEYEVPRDGQLIFYFSRGEYYLGMSPELVSANIRGWQKHKSLGVSCYLHGGDRGVAHFDGTHLFWPKDVEAARLDANRIAKKRAAEDRLKADLENPAEPSFSLISKLGRIAVAQFERLDFSTVIDPEVVQWHQAMLARNQTK